MTYKISPSSLNLMTECPRCFWLQTVKKIRRPRSPMAGIVMTMDSHIKAYFDTYRERGVLPDIIKGKVEGKLAKDMPNTLQHTDKKTGLIIWGRPDEYLELKDGSIVAFDHKTKSKAPDEAHPANIRQIDVYTYLLQRTGRKTTNKGFLAYYYPEKCMLHKGMDIQVKIIELKPSIKKAEKLVKEAHEIINGKMPKASEECDFCRWIKEAGKSGS